MGSSCFFAFSDHEVQELSQQANIHWKLQWTSIKPEVPRSRLCWTISPALGSAPGGDGTLQADVSDNSSCSPSSVFMLKILASKRCTAAMKCTLFWRLTYLTYPGMWVIWGYHGETKKPQKPLCKAGGQLPTNTQVLTWPWCTLLGTLPINIIGLWQRWQHSSQPACRFSCT